MCAQYDNDKILYTGGKMGSVLESTFIYDLNSDSWETQASWNLPNSGLFGAKAIRAGNGKVYLIGGKYG